jgi:hypothetical protein
MIKYEKYLLHLMCYVHVLIMVFIVLPLFPAVNNKQKIIKMHTKVIYCTYLNRSKYLPCLDLSYSRRAIKLCNGYSDTPIRLRW